MESTFTRPKLSGPLPVRLFEADYHQLHEIAHAKDRKVSSLVRKAVREYLAAKQISPGAVEGSKAESTSREDSREGLNV